MKVFSGVLARAIEEGLIAVALVDRDGKTIGLAGAITDEEAMPLAALVMYRLKSADLAPRLFAGEVVSLTLDDREVAVGIARRQLFVVAVLGTSTLERVGELRDQVGRMLASDEIQAPPWQRNGGGGSGSGPAELPVIELGVTVRRDRN